jgi:hypothetical protein
MAKKKDFNVQITVSHGDKSATSKYKISYSSVKDAYFSEAVSSVETDEDEAEVARLEIPASKISKVLKTIADQTAYEAKDNTDEYVLGAVEALNTPPKRRGGGR